MSKKTTRGAKPKPPRRKLRYGTIGLLLIAVLLVVLNNKVSLSLSVNNAAKNNKYTVVLDAGHGGSDTGAIHLDEQGKIDLREKDITLQVVLKTGRKLEAEGYRVVYTRVADVSANGQNRDLNGDKLINEQDDLYARIEMANQSQADIFISVHVNGSQFGNETGGTETWYCAERPFANQSKLLAGLIQKEGVDSLTNLAGGYIIQDRGVLDDGASSSNLHLATLGPTTPTRKIATNMPGVLTEILFLSNNTEAGLLGQDVVLEQLAAGYSRAINNYFNGAAA